MSDSTQGIFLLGVFLLVLAVIFETPIAGGGGAVIMMVGLVYSYVVSQREVERSRRMDYEDRKSLID